LKCSGFGITLHPKKALFPICINPLKLVRFAHNWNDGVMGFGKMEKWVIDEICLDSVVEKNP
jgi:hypothetical protein